MVKNGTKSGTTTPDLRPALFFYEQLLTSPALHHSGGGRAAFCQLAGSHADSKGRYPPQTARSSQAASATLLHPCGTASLPQVQRHVPFMHWRHPILLDASCRLRLSRRQGYASPLRALDCVASSAWAVQEDGMPCPVGQFATWRTNCRRTQKKTAGRNLRQTRRNRYLWMKAAYAPNRVATTMKG